nr:cell surface protein SprA [Dysgonomonas sp. 25]
MVIIIFSVCSVSLFSGIGAGRNLSGMDSSLLPEIAYQDTIQPQDTIVRFPVKRTQITNYGDLNQTNPIDLKDPGNIQTEVDYDPKSGLYMFRTRLGDDSYFTPFTLTFDEYSDYTLKQSMSDYFRQRNALSAAGKSDKDNDFVLKNINLSMTPLDRIFGPGGVKLNLNGYAEAKLGLKRTTSKNPTLSQRSRNRTTFDFDQDIQVNVDASVGEKVNFDLNYDTKAAFDFDSKKIKLGYQGHEDEIIKKIEAGNVSMATTNSLINGGSALFGINTELQFGRLRVNAIVAQQEAESRSLQTEGGVQNTEFEFRSSDYDENRHFFLGHYFRDHYDEGMSQLPAVVSKITISRIEVWVTNKRGNYEQARNFVAFADLGESDKIKNTTQWGTIAPSMPYNGANTLYNGMISTYSGIRDISRVNSLLGAIPLENGQDYEKVERARLLSSTEYTYNAQLGYLSLTSALQSDEVLAVAFEYQYQGTTYQVGEFSADIVETYEPGNAKSGSLILKLLKPVSLSPNSYSWDLMMKNVYSLGAANNMTVNNVQKEGFRLQIAYQTDSVGTYLTYLTEGAIKDKPLLNVMNMDRLNSNDKPVQDGRGNIGDGIFDYIDGFTVKAENGRIFFPVVEPFGSWLDQKIGSATIAQKYVYPELYTLSKTAAEQVAEKNKFKIYGKYRGSSSASTGDISLNATNVPQGSVRVTAGGQQLTEGVDYIIDYLSGTVTIINEEIKESNTPVQVSLEDRTFSMQRKTLLGMNLSYEFSKKLTMGGTIMHMYEKPLTNKTTIGSESVKNTLWGLNMSYNSQSQWLTNMIDKLPFVEATQPSQISFTGEFAQLIAGHYKNGNMGGYSYIDDFESSESRIDLKNPYGWALSSTPSFFPEATLSNDINYGKNRAMMSWFMIDGMFTRKGSSLTPQHIKNDKKQLSNHFVREIGIRELYPNKDLSFDDAGVISALNISYYPEERGPYNLDATNIDSDGKLRDPDKRWGGITRKLEIRDFETSNVEYIEFWLMDPFVYNDTLPPALQNKGGDFYIDLGDISEDVLKDGKKFYENGLPTDGDLTSVEYTEWGKVPKRQSTVYAFDNNLSDEQKRRQDVGLNGLSTEEELNFPAYSNYVTAYRAALSPTAETEQSANPFSPLNDPSGDNFHFYRSSYYDEQKTSILDRYKYFNGSEGNTVGFPDEKYSTTARTVPDVEDMDQDNTMNETESYYQYKLELKPTKMQVGQNCITEMREVEVDLRDGSKGKVKWYQFKIPVRQPTSKKGNISGFKSIRFMRMFMTEFTQTTFLRFGTLQLVRGDWRTYENTLNANNAPSGTGTIDVTRVNIEENSNKQPVSYVLPPGLSRSETANQAQLLQDNEQSLSLTVNSLDAKDARGVYKNTMYDMRRYKRLQMFTHAEQLINGTPLEDGDFSVFIRLGSDYKNNYYEYEVPLSLTPHDTYQNSNNAHREIVWPAGNMLDFPLEILKDLKLSRNKKKRVAGSTINYTTVYSEYDPYKPANKISIVGNPSLAEVYVIMIGVRNNSRHTRSGEVWVNELRLTDFDDEGGWAAQGNLNVALSDIGTVNVAGRKETVGFGALDQSLLERRQDDYTIYNISVNLDLGRFIPEKAKLSIPFYYAYSNQETKPEYDPFNTDVKLNESIAAMDTKAEKDSVKSLAVERMTTRSLSFTNVKSNVQSKTPMPYDPANFSFNYAYNQSNNETPTTAYDKAKDYKLGVSYTYTPLAKTWEPFKNVKGKSGTAKFAKSIGFNYLPSNIAFNSVMTRYYTETLTRDIESIYAGGGSDQKFLTWSQSFYWDRDFSMNWDLTKNLKISFQSGTRAEIEEPYLQVNKNVNRDDYDRWRDTVWNSIKHLGDPLSYKQYAKVTYQIPTRSVPALDWITSNASYESSYQWDRGVNIGVDSLTMGNTINNMMTLGITSRMDLTSLYRKSSYLRKVNERFDRRTSNRQAQRRPQAQERQQPKKRFTQEILLTKDSAYTLRHGLDTKKLEILAKKDGKPYKLKYKRIDNNTIRITNKDSARIQLSVESKQVDGEGNKFWSDVADYSARGLMSIRNIELKYSNRKETSISGFKPKVGDMFGQKNYSDYGMTPGLGFAFGFDGGEDFVNKAYDRNWLLMNDYNTIPAIYNQAEKMEIRSQIEPFKGFRIEVNAGRERNRRTEYQYMYDGQPRLYGGSFSITTIALSSAFDSGNAKNGYKSKAFDRFLRNRMSVKYRLENKYQHVNYPNAGFIASDPNNSGYRGNPYDPTTAGDVSLNSPDVLIPAFLAAYTGNSADKISLSAFPSLWKLLPNWTINYDGLTNIPFIKQHFKSIRLNHAYNCTYQVGNYNSFTTWVEADGGDGLGFIRDVLSGKPVPSSPYNISSVSIVEAFNPLIGLEGVMSNSLSFNGRYNNSRTLTLNTSSYQIIETLQKELVVGMGYRINDFNRVIGLTAKPAEGVNNDLNLKVDLSHRTQQTLIRKIQENYTQATAGTTIITLKCSAAYTMTRALTLSAFFDHIINEPLITAVGYPTTNSNFGISLKFTLQQ